jgi:selenide,water dikinase
MMEDQASKVHECVLVGGGHANIQVIKNFAMNPIKGLRLTLVSDQLEAPYSGMLPGFMAGLYDHHELHFDLRKICADAGVRFIKSAAIGLCAEKRELFLEGYPTLYFDSMVINVGIQPEPLKVESNANHIYPLKPISRFINHWRNFQKEVKTWSSPKTLRIAVVGGGAAGVETAIVISTYLRGLEIDHHVQLFQKSEQLLKGYSASAQKKIKKILDRNGIEVRLSCGVVSAEGQRLILSDKTVHPFEFAFVATHAKAPSWFQATDLQLDSDGFLKTKASLQSESHPFVFGAGDCVSFPKKLPRSGVFAVREGGFLKTQLWRFISGSPLRAFKPQKKTLALINSGYKRAIGFYGPFSFEGSWVWRLKDLIDQRFMRRFQYIPKMPEKIKYKIDLTKRFEVEKNQCGGCGSKVESKVLRGVLTKACHDTGIKMMDGAFDQDASLLDLKGGKGLYTEDAFRLFGQDPYLNGRVLVEHACNDLFARGSTPLSAGVFLMLPQHLNAKITESDFYQCITGIFEGLKKQNLSLLGGHTMESEQLSLGLSLVGDFPDHLIKKDIRTEGDLVLTKALGSGALLASYMGGMPSGYDLEHLFEGMLFSNKEAVKILKEGGCKAATDVTGFGFIGHLLEMLKADTLQAQIFLDRIREYQGFKECRRKRVSSFLEEKNKENFGSLVNGSELPDLLFDPQTSGPLLALVQPGKGEELEARLKSIGYQGAACVGQVKRAKDGLSAGRVSIV